MTTSRVSRTDNFAAESPYPTPPIKTKTKPAPMGGDKRTDEEGGGGKQDTMKKGRFQNRNRLVYCFLQDPLKVAEVRLRRPLAKGCYRQAVGCTPILSRIRRNVHQAEVWRLPQARTASTKNRQHHHPDNLQTGCEVEIYACDFDLKKIWL